MRAEVTSSARPAGREQDRVQIGVEAANKKRRPFSGRLAKSRIEKARYFL
jgi:hypothetical protein